MTSVDVDTTTLYIRVTMFEPKLPPALDEFTERLVNLNSLLFVSALAAEVWPNPWSTSSGKTEEGSSPVLYSPEAVNLAFGVAGSFRVDRVTYQSPIEIVLLATVSVTLVSGSIYLTANRMLKIWDKVNDSRKKHSDTQLQIAANDVVRKELRLLGERIQIGSSMDRTGLNSPKPRPEVVSEAARALVEIQRLQINDGQS